MAGQNRALLGTPHGLGKVVSSRRHARVFAKGPKRGKLATGLRRVFLQDEIQSLQEDFSVKFGENQRRAQLDDVVMRSVGAGENAAIAKAVDHVGGLQRSRLTRFTVEHKIDPQEQSRAAHIADQSVAGLQSLQAFDKMRANALGVLL